MNRTTLLIICLVLVVAVAAAYFIAQRGSRDLSSPDAIVPHGSAEPGVSPVGPATRGGGVSPKDATGRDDGR
ncbi:MAG TPA: hypothetical protein VEL07_22515 [Planctomycetota bacterium]|nr:hypothetical protein [Planctomycetota bacterium]